MLRIRLGRRLTINSLCSRPYKSWPTSLSLHAAILLTWLSILLLRVLSDSCLVLSWISSLEGCIILWHLLLIIWEYLLLCLILSILYTSWNWYWVTTLSKLFKKFCQRRSPSIYYLLIGLLFIYPSRLRLHLCSLLLSGRLRIQLVDCTLMPRSTPHHSSNLLLRLRRELSNWWEIRSCRLTHYSCWWIILCTNGKRLNMCLIRT